METTRRYVNQLRPGEALDQVFLVREKELRTTRSGDHYITCMLADRTGNLPARMWQASEGIFKAIEPDGFLHVKGRTEDYKGTLQFVIEACRPWPAQKVDLSDFVPVTELDIEEMWSQLLAILRGVKDNWLRLLIKKFVEDRDMVAAFKKSPAALTMHHPFVGGLLEHTLAVTKAAAAILPLYPKLNADLLLTGAFLHDIGKTAELSAGTNMQYTERGQLVGHITIAAIWIAEKTAALSAEVADPFPAKTLNLLEHIVLSHHGQLEFGSPKLPCIPEAFVLHYLDNLDAKMFMTTRQITNDADPNAAFTSYHKDLQTRIYKNSAEL